VDDGVKMSELVDFFGELYGLADAGQIGLQGCSGAGDGF